ncbi:Glycerol-3-phosphate responsive antiterminator [Poriferisphaera corsica]|uniref:Glycerol-3-phosphate responsive antiterminator n=1 Tax=Poriferisphaera corsica TaxID=2528020 RepID=A0A517YW07_9BACT|nr:glycerol-3-phosphate responsive antiterminator [Poriferisphaera corsica]QDU34398.1 Glycerol-3-phosphate responsive antiterminator [Poriferisphaera corsica]
MARKKPQSKPHAITFSKPVIPVLWDNDIPDNLLQAADAVFLQGGAISDLARILAPFETSAAKKIPLFLNIDLLAGLNSDEAALNYLTSAFPRITGIITTRHQLTNVAHRLGLAAIVRVFLQDSRALDRGIHIVKNNKPDALELLPGIAAAHVASDFLSLDIPILGGGLIKTAQTVESIINAGCSAVSTSKPDLWSLNLI